ncbi:MAG TPA: CoA ester lyase [Anaerolineaceae bacterium]|nr:CoA ester lyase [Anaerolineales bacterium]HIQ08996.1 CoA ester lyase [Anaerolineaceae bacterium]
MNMRARRALLYVPGSDQRKLEKAAGLEVDSVCMDLEDGVALGQKAAARAMVAQALRALDFGRTERVVRINAVGSGLETDDLAAVLPARPDTIMVPKVEQADQLRWVDEQLARAEAAHGWPQGSTALLALIETARGVVNLAAIAQATPRLQALGFGAEDLMADIGGKRTASNREVVFPRSQMALVAAAFGLQAIDMVYVRYKDLEGLRSETEEAAVLGYQGKQVIHPAQVPVVQQVFTPSAEEIAYAQKVLAAMKAAEARGEGVIGLEGKMIDMPMIRAAQRVLARARAAGLV